MKIISSKNKLTKIIQKEKDLGFVPTMGAIHKGHISLVKKSNKECKKTIVSIFVNKQQFNKKRDYQKYPRILKKDIFILKNNKVDYIYIPTLKQIYPYGYNKKITISSFSKKLCGMYRPRHFEAIADVVERFINLINPSKIFLGEKDMQQLLILKDFFKKKKFKTKIVGCKTIREKNGIACSSRNLLLSINDKKIASKVYQLILKNKKNILKSKISIKKIKYKILSLGAKKIDYLEVVDINKIIKPYKKNTNKRIFIGYYLGYIRLIDNI